MSESDIDMDRCLRGIDDEKACVPEITWTNCSEQMPPYDPIIVVDLLDHSKYIITHGESLALYIRKEWRVRRRHFKWTEFSEEKWKELNK